MRCACVVSRLFWHTSPKATAPYFRRLQLVSAALYSLGHGTNDAQKTMGVVALLLYANGYLARPSTCPSGSSSWRGAAIAAGHHGRRLADHQDHGHAHHQAPAGGRLLRREPRPRSRSSAPPRPASPSAPRTPSPAPSSAWAPPAPVRGALGGHHRGRLGLGADHPRARGADRCIAFCLAQHAGLGRGSRIRSAFSQGFTQHREPWKDRVIIPAVCHELRMRAEHYWVCC